MNLPTDQIPDPMVRLDHVPATHQELLEALRAAPETRLGPDPAPPPLGGLTVDLTAFPTGKVMARFVGRLPEPKGTQVSITKLEPGDDPLEVAAWALGYLFELPGTPTLRPEPRTQGTTIAAQP